MAGSPSSPATALTATTYTATGTRADAAWLIRQWQEARLQASRADKPFVFAIDEVQKIPHWSDTVKGLWDADRAAGLPMHVILLGSSPLLVQDGLTESLMGRFEPEKRDGTYADAGFRLSPLSSTGDSFPFRV